VDGHALMFQVNTLQDESALPSAYRGREWYDPSADKK